MTAVHGTCTAFAGDILMPVGGFDDFAAEFTLYGVSDDFSHFAPPCFGSTQYTT